MLVVVEVPLKTLEATKLPEAVFKRDGQTWELVCAKVHASVCYGLFF